MGDISFDERQRTRNSFLSAYPRAVIVLNLHNPTPAFDPKAFGVIHSLSSPYAEGVRLHIFYDTHTATKLSSHTHIHNSAVCDCPLVGRSTRPISHGIKPHFHGSFLRFLTPEELAVLL